LVNYIYKNLKKPSRFWKNPMFENLHECWAKTFLCLHIRICLRASLRVYQGTKE